MADNSISLMKGDSKIFAFACYDKDGNGLVLSGAHKVILTFRATETSEKPLIQKLGVVEYVGTGPEDPGIVTAETMPEDSIDISETETWYDAKILFLGHWFDQGSHSGLTFHYQYGKTREVVSEVGVWHEVEAGSLLLENNSVNYVEVTPAGVISSNITEFTEGSIPLYTVTTTGGVITNVTDNRTIWGRGDRVFTSAKARFYPLETITKKAELQSLGG